MCGETSNLSVLDSEHADTLKHALTRLLSTEVAEATYSEILDGLPTVDSYCELHYQQTDHPVFQLDHSSLCPGVTERIQSFRRDFDPSQLRFAYALLSAFQRTHPGTQKFELRLIELLAVVCHQIAVYLFELDDGPHKHRLYEDWRHQQRGRTDDYFAPTAFWHGWYVDFDQYPNGMADIVGYWAEAKIFGGVVVFDRGPSGTEASLLPPGYIRGPRTIFPPTPARFNSRIDFLLGPEPAYRSACPFPIRATAENRWRYDPWDAMTRFNIFRDRYERKPPVGEKPHRCVKSATDWPELGDEHLVTLLQWEASQGKPVNQADIDAVYERMKQITPSSPLWPRWRDPGPP